MKILFLASEVAPFTKTGGLGDVAHALPAALARLGHDVLVVTPRYASMNASKLEPLGARIRLRFPFGEESAELLTAPSSPGVRVVFLEHPGFFGRPALYGDARGDYPDNHRRFAFFAIGALAAAQTLRFEPDVVHLNDWQTGLAAAALKRGYAGTAIGKAKCVFTVHNLAFQGLFPKGVMQDLGLPWDVFTPDGLEFYDGVNFLKAGLAFSDAWTTVSPTYAKEIQTPAFGCNLDGFIQARAERLVGIVNGVDVEEWDPSRDRYLPATYDSGDLAPKAVCKEALRTRLGLPARPGRRPLFGMVSRLTSQKGIDLVLRALPRALEGDIEVVLLGSGERGYEDGFRALARAFPSQVGVHVGFDAGLSHLLEAGSDFFLMPSQYEPCGLNQMYSLRYGTPPVVRATGGLEDTVVDAELPAGNGFKFQEYRDTSLLWAMDRARAVFENPARLLALQRSGMGADFSWSASARKYAELYVR